MGWEVNDHHVLDAGRGTPGHGPQEELGRGKRDAIGQVVAPGAGDPRLNASPVLMRDVQGRPVDPSGGTQEAELGDCLIELAVTDHDSVCERPWTSDQAARAAS